MKNGTIKRLVKHTLSSLEVEDYHKSLVCSMRARDEADKQFDEVKAEHKKHVTDLQVEIDKYRLGCERGWEERQVDCTVELSPEENKKRFYRIDTGELVGTEEMNDYDRQLTIKEVDMKAPQVSVGQTIVLWEAGADLGLMDIQFDPSEKAWKYGLEMKIGNARGEVLISQLKATFANREDAVKMGAKAALKWIKQVAPDHLEGFKAGIQAVVEKEKGKVE